MCSRRKITGFLAFVAAPMAVALLPTFASAQAIGQFDHVPLNPADEAYIFTPPGFAREGKPAVASGEDAGRLEVIVRDRATGRATPCRVNVVGAGGDFYRPAPGRLTPHDLTGAYPRGLGNRPTKAPIRYLGRFFYTLGEFQVDVPAGRVRVEVWKGYEYTPVVAEARVEKGATRRIEVTIDRAASMSGHGWQSGDPHLHFDRRHEKDSELILDLLEAEDVHHGVILCYNADTASYTGEMSQQETPQLLGLGAPTVLQRGEYGIISGQEYRSSHYGHLMLYLRESLALDGARLDPSTWPVYGEVGRETRAQGGLSFYAHGGYAQEVYADLAQGAVDGVELLQFGIYRGIGLEGWYNMLGAGFRFPAIGASDYPMCRWLGDCRTYVQHDGRPTFAEWLRGLAAGRSFVTSGPLLLLEVDGAGPGAVSQRSGPGPHPARVRVRARCEVAPVTGIQVIVNGRAVEELTVPPEKRRGVWIEIEKTITLPGPAWIAARAWSKAPGGSPDAEAHTNPVYVEVDGRAPFSVEAAGWLIQRLDEQIAALERRIFPRQLDALAYFRRSRQVLIDLREHGGGRGSKAPESAGRLEDLLRPVPPREPGEALRTIEVKAGFRMVLAAAEPAVMDPIAGTFDEDGRLYVAEMRDYPYKPRPGDAPLGRVSLLEDEDGDGRFERSSLFAKELLWPSGLAPWKGGVFIAAAPDIWYMKDTDGDRRADLRRRVFTGFGTGNQQGMLNNLIWGLDHKIYGASSMEGGEVRPAERPDAPPIPVRGRDFRFDAESQVLEAISGTAQFGNAFDDWGNRFVCSESRPALHVVLPQERLARNQYFSAPEVITNIVEGGIAVRRISPVEGWRLIRSSRRVETEYLPAANAAVSHDLMTGVAGVTIYRGDAYPEDHRGDLFVSDAQTNVIQRRKLVPDGVTFKAIRADTDTEFVRSSDIWFRPVNLLNAPDGTLYALDMYREFLETVHLPLDVVRHLDLTSGRDRGRIWRIEPEGFKQRAVPRLSRASTADLVKLLESPNGWHRDTAHRLLHERQDRAAVGPLRRLLEASPRPEARLHALWSLEGLRALELDDLTLALADPAPPVREHGLRLAEPRLGSAPQLLEKLLTLADDPDPRVGLEAAFTLGSTKDPRAVAALARIARRRAGDRWTRAAVLSSAVDCSGALLAELIQDSSFAGSETGPVWLEALASIAGARGEPSGAARAADAIAGCARLEVGPRRRLVLTLAEGLRRSGGRLEGLPGLSGPAKELWSGLSTWARGVAADTSAAESDRTEAIRRLALSEFDPFGVMLDLTKVLARPDPPAVQAAAVRALTGWNDPAIAPAIIAAWDGYAPQVKEEALRALLSRQDGTHALLDAIESGRVSRSEVGAARRTLLLQSSDAAVQARAKKVFEEAAATPRGEVLARYRTALAAAESRADPRRGEKVYEQQCMQCHPFGAKGHAVGPNLALTQNRTPEALLEEILDPNRDVNPAYIEYAVVAKDGQAFTGIIGAETASGITLKRAQGAQDTVLRQDIAEVRGMGRSLMPENLETAVDPEAMADLIAYILAGRYDLGTEPGIVEPGPEKPAPEKPAPDKPPPPHDPRVLAQLERSLERFRTAADWESRRREIREGLLRGAGLWPLPEKPPLRVIARGRREHSGYSVENVALETFPGFYLTGNLYRPIGRRGPFAAVLCPHGHFRPLGRFRAEHQLRCAHLARMGAAVFSYGMVGWQDSRQTTHDDPLVLALQLWNSLRAVDYITGLEGVDPKRVGVTGASGGGTQTVFLAVADERIAAAAPAVIVYPWSWFSGGACRCENGMPAMKSAETNMIELAAAIAPRPQLIISCGLAAEGKTDRDPTHDFPTVGLPFIQEVYRRSGQAEKLQSLHLASEAHDYGPAKRKAAYAFLAGALRLEPLEEDVATIAIEPPETLEVFNDSHPLPEGALKGSAAVGEAFERLVGASGPR